MIAVFDAGESARKADRPELFTQKLYDVAGRYSTRQSLRLVLSVDENPKPFIWVKTAEAILESIAKRLIRMNGSGH